jgi:hypothetical protein
MGSFTDTDVKVSFLEHTYPEAFEYSRKSRNCCFSFMTRRSLTAVPDLALYFVFLPLFQSILPVTETGQGDLITPCRRASGITVYKHT